MNDPRIASMIAAVVARHPGARVELHPSLPEEIPVPTFLIVLDADGSALRQLEQFAIDLMSSLFRGEPAPVWVLAVDPAKASAYRRDATAALRPVAKA
jgi:hypothetical protein